MQPNFSSSRHHLLPASPLRQNGSDLTLTGGAGSRSPEPPEFLIDPIALEEWKCVVSIFVFEGRLSAVHYTLLAGYCLAVARAVRAEEAVAREGRYYTTATSQGSVYRRRHPAVQDAEKGWVMARRFARQLGISDAGTSPDNLTTPRRAIFK